MSSLRSKELANTPGEHRVEEERNREGGVEFKKEVWGMGAEMGLGIEGMLLL